MIPRSNKKEVGFSVVEVAVVVVLVGVVIAFAAPRIANAMREYRLSLGIRQVVDAIKRAKTQAIANNKTSSLFVDVANRKIGLFTFDNAGNVLRTDYVSLPDDVSFALPANIVAPVSGAPISATVSFPLKSGSTSIFQQDFSTRGFPVVASAADINVIYMTNGSSYRAVTFNSYGGTRTWWWKGTVWQDTAN